MKTLINTFTLCKPKSIPKASTSICRTQLTATSENTNANPTLTMREGPIAITSSIFTQKTEKYLFTGYWKKQNASGAAME